MKASTLNKIPPQQLEWMKFQESISVSGSDSNPSELSHNAGRQTKKVAAREAEEAEEERQRLTTSGGGWYPPLRYSPEETEKLLAQAYAAIPPRAGPRRHRHKKREKVRWFRVRKIRKKYKRHLRRAHERRMIERSERVKSVKETLNSASERVAKDRAYQARILQRWMETMQDTDGHEEQDESGQSIHVGTNN